jgi:hypothetical protein
MERKVLYFDKPGPKNTKSCLDIVKKILKEEKIRDIVVASTKGETGLLFAEELKDFDINLVVVTHSYGFREPNTLEMSDETRERILKLGAKVYTGTMITHTLETALAQKFGGVYPTLLVAQTLRRFGEGPKVCCEIVMMAADAGLIPEGIEVLAVAGTARGADTVMILRSSTSKRFLDLKVLEILAKPRS